MFTKLTKKIFAFFIIALTGCAAINNPSTTEPQAPVSENFQSSYQKQLNASSHWSVIANDMSDQLIGTLNKKALKDKPVYLNLYSEPTAFTDAFNDFLTTHLVKKGIFVSKSRMGATIYNYKIQPIKYKSNRSALLPDKLKWTSLATGVVVVRNLARILNVDGDIIAGGLAADAWFDGMAPKLELIINSSILSQNIYIYKTTDVYYANDSDLHLYENNKKNVVNKNNVFDDPFYKN